MGATDTSGFGSSRRIEVISETRLPPEKAFCPVAIS